MLASFFRGENRKKHLPFCGKSQWAPPKHGVQEEVLKLMEEDGVILRGVSRPYSERKKNITKLEWKELIKLRNNKNIVIKPADKGSAIVIMNREQYCKEVYRQLKDEKYYKKLDSPIYMQTIPLVADILDSLMRKKYITHKQRKYLGGSIPPRERRFYILPKIHKEPAKWSWPYQIPPGRPIVSDCGSETYHTAEYIDRFLTPLSIKHASYVKDTYHFLEVSQGITLPRSFFLFTMDIDSLYTNIDIPSGLTAVAEIFKKYPDPKRPDSEILKLLEINLTRNDFEFNSEYFLQIKGTAMGKKFAPAYANIFMAKWEGEVLRKCPIRPYTYLRYLDDIFGIWPGSREEFEEFVKTLNSHDPSIQVKFEIDKDAINFLDTTMYRGPRYLSDNKLDSKVYFKPTDTHALLHYNSFHPKHTFRGIVKSQILRFSRICTENEEFQKAVRVLFSVLRKRGYSRSFLRRCLRDYKAVKQREDKQILPIITLYSTKLKKIHSKLKKNYDFWLGQSSTFKNYRVISAYKRNKNLKDILTRASLKRNPEKEKTQ